MQDTIMQYLKRHLNKVIVLLIIITAIGAFLRLYDHGDWLHFELDQARDAKIISAAIESGPGELPLQGPRAAGSFLRLGPASYYLNYISALVFGNTPQGMAMLITLLSILSIPLLYYLLVRYFSSSITLALVAIYAISPFFVLYSRFAWNPNILPFFLILGMLGLLKAVDRTETRRGAWLVISATSLSIATQAHFVALLALALIVPIYLLIKRPRIALVAWMLAIFSIGITYSPLVVNDIYTGGKNYNAFIEAFTEKSEESKHNKVEHVIHVYTEYTVGYHRILTGDEKTEIFRTKPESGIMIDILCDKQCRSSMIIWSIDLVLMGLALVLLLKNTWRERVRQKKDFLILMVVWFGVGGLLFYPIVFDIAPRFFLVTVVIPFVLFGLLVQWLVQKGKCFSLLAIALVLLSVVPSVYHIYDRLDQLNRASSEAVELPTSDRILKERGRVTLEVQENVAQYLQELQSQNGYPVYLYSEPFYARSLGYILNEKGVPYDGLKVNTVHQNGNHVFVLRSQATFDTKFAKYSEKYDVIDKKELGTMVVYHVVPKSHAVTDIAGDLEEFTGYSNEQSDRADHKRYTWKEIF